MGEDLQSMTHDLTLVFLYKRIVLERERTQFIQESAKIRAFQTKQLKHGSYVHLSRLESEAKQWKNTGKKSMFVQSLTARGTPSDDPYQRRRTGFVGSS